MVKAREIVNVKKVQFFSSLIYSDAAVNWAEKVFKLFLNLPKK